MWGSVAGMSNSFHDLVTKMAPMLDEDFNPTEPLAEAETEAAEREARLAAKAKVRRGDGG
jgi:hypothetical protein